MNESFQLNQPKETLVRLFGLFVKYEQNLTKSFRSVQRNSFIKSLIVPNRHLKGLLIGRRGLLTGPTQA